MPRKAAANLSAIVVCLVFSLGALGQTPAGPAAAGPDLSSMIPPEAIFWLERHGHTAVKPAFDASNLGQLAHDAAMNKFIHETRVKIGRMIVKQMFDLETEADIGSHQETLHKFLLPFWYNNCAAFAILKKESRAPAMGFYCVTGQYQKQCKDAVEAMMKVGVPGEGAAGERQAFTYSSGAIKWSGVAKQHEEWSLAKDDKERAEQFKKSSLFMVAWSGDLLLVATDIAAADSAAMMLPGAANRPASKSASPGYQAVLAQTPLKDWAFRWYVDMEQVNKLMGESGGGFYGGMINVVGIDGMRSIGGVGGYSDNVFTRTTFLDAPTPSGVLSLLARDGSYKAGLALLPPNCPLAVAVQIDAKALPQWVRQTMISQKQQMELMRVRWETVEVGVEEDPATMPSAVPATRPAAPTSMPAVKLDEDEEKLLKQIEAICQSSTGAGALAITELPDMQGPGPSGVPICIVIELKDAAKASKVIDEAIKEGDSAGAGPATHLGVTIRNLSESMLVAVAKDRLIFAGTEPAMKAAIGVAMEAPTSQPSAQMARMTALTGDGSAILQFDLPALTKWFLPTFAGIAGGEDSPLAQMPEPDKLAGLLGPEIIVIQPTRNGWLFKSRGTVPFLTKILMTQGSGLAYMIPMMVESRMDIRSGPSGRPGTPPRLDPNGF